MENFFSTSETLCFQDYDSFFHPFDLCSFELSYDHKDVPAVQNPVNWLELEDQFGSLLFPGNEQVMAQDQISSELFARFEIDCFLGSDPLYDSLDIVPTQDGREEFSSFGENAVERFEEEEKQVVVYERYQKESSVMAEKEFDLMCENYEKESSVIAEKKTDLTRATIARYFYLPITEAAKELNIGLTLLKKRCREVGIPRWPHRKLMSLQSLIKTVQDMDLEEEENRGVIETLQKEMKLIEEMPDIDLGDKTKKLRQACFKMNYKKRKHMQMLEWPSFTDYGSIDSSTSDTIKNVRMKMEQL